ncbi:MAG: FecR domain-containing protein [Myxococcales bacterium]
MNAPCDRFAELTLAEAEGRMLSTSDLAFRHNHCTSCAACRAETEALAVLRMPAGAPAHFHTPAAERARTIDAVLAAVDSPDFVVDAPPAEPAQVESAADNVVPFARRIKKPAMWVGGLVAAAAALLLVVRVSGPASQDLRPAPTARVLLASGAGLSAGAALAEGQEFGSGTGELSVALGSDIVLLLDPGSKAKLTQVTAKGIEVALETGRVHASVVPNTPGPKLAITTRDGRVEVTGTLFSVEAKDGASHLRVLRGSVKVSAPGKKQTAVTAFQAQKLGTEEIRAMTPDEQESELAAQRRIGLLEVAEPTVLQVRSRPEGAQVSLDGETIGVTPLSAEVRTGRRHLVVASAGNSAEESIDLHGGKVETRDFDLAPAVAVVEGPDTEADPEPAKPNSRHLVRKPSFKGSMKEMLERAQLMRQAKNWTESAAAYRELLAAYPNASTIESAYVSYGDVLMQLGQYKASLKACGTYLDRTPGGVNAPEAWECRIRSFHALGRFAEEKAAIAELQRDWPNSLQAKAHPKSP